MTMPLSNLGAYLGSLTPSRLSVLVDQYQNWEQTGVLDDESELRSEASLFSGDTVSIVLAAQEVARIAYQILLEDALDRLVKLNDLMEDFDDAVRGVFDGASATVARPVERVFLAMGKVLREGIM